MRLVSDAFDSEVAGSTSRDYLDVNVWRGGVLLVAGLAVTDWSLSWDATRQVQGQASFTVADPDGTLAPWSLADPLGPGGSRLQVTWVSGLSGTRVPLGWWRIRKADPTESWRLYRTSQPTKVTLGAADRTNLVTDPRVTAWNNTTGTTLGLSTSRWFGGGSATGTHTIVTGATDGPTPELTSYGRKTWTNVTGGGQGDTGITSNNWTGYTQGAIYTASVWVRASVQRGYSPEVGFTDGAGVSAERFVPSASTVMNVPAGQWVRLSMTFAAPNFTGRIAMVWDTDAGTAWAVGSTLDITGFLVERDPTGALGALYRTNWANNTRATSFAGAYPKISNDRYSGDGTYALATATAPPGTTITTVARFTVTTPRTGHGFHLSGNPQGGVPSGSTALPVAAGDQWTVSCYVRKMGGTMVPVGVYIRVGTGTAWAAAATVGTPVTTVAGGVWVRVSHTVIIPAGGNRLDFMVTNTSATADAAGDVWECTGLVVEQVGTVGAFFDGQEAGATTDYSWTGTPQQSPSVQRDVPKGAPVGTYFDGLTADTLELAYSWTGAANASTSVRQPKVLTYATTVLRTSGGGFVKVQADEETATAVLNRMDAEVVTQGTCLAEVRRLLQDVCPVTVDPAVVDLPVPSALVYSEARMDAVEDLLAAIYAVHRMGPDGSFQVVPAAGVGPVWTIAGGEDGVLVAVVRALSDENVYNGATSTGETPQGLPLVGRAYTTTGPLAWGGPFGKVPVFHQAIATTGSGVQTDAQTVLATSATAGEVELAVRCLTHPGLQVNDRVTLVAPTRSGQAAITARVLAMSMASAGSAPAKAMDLTVRVAADALEVIASEARRG